MTSNARVVIGAQVKVGRRTYYVPCSTEKRNSSLLYYSNYWDRSNDGSLLHGEYWEFLFPNSQRITNPNGYVSYDLHPSENVHYFGGVVGGYLNVDDGPYAYKGIFYVDGDPVIEGGKTYYPVHSKDFRAAKDWYSREPYGDWEQLTDTVTNRLDITDRLRPSLVASSSGLGSFKYNEPDSIYLCREFGRPDIRMSIPMSEAYLDACRNLPYSEVNSLGNLMEVANLARSIIARDFGQVPKDLKQAVANGWLSYRYSYSTTKSDVRSYRRDISRITSLLDTAQTNVTQHGQSTFGSHALRCTAEFALALPSSVKSWAEALGLKLSMANAWDIIPYSFVVDWFLSVGDFLEKIDSIGQSREFHCNRVYYTLHYSDENSECFSRWSMDKPPDAAFALFYSEESETKTKTVVKRIIDSASLIIQR